MAALLLLLAVVGGILVGDLVLENPAAGAVENASVREELAHRDRPLPGPAEAARPDELGSAWTASVAEGQARSCPCRSTATPSRSPSRLGRPPASAATWTDEV